MANVKDFIDENLDEEVDEINEAKTEAGPFRKEHAKKMNSFGPKVVTFKDPGAQLKGLPGEIGTWYHNMLKANKTYKKLVMSLPESGIVDKTKIKAVQVAEKALAELVSQISSKQAAITAFKKKSETETRLAGYKTAKKTAKVEKKAAKKITTKEKQAQFKANVKKKVASINTTAKKAGKKIKDSNPAKDLFAQFKKS